MRSIVRPLVLLLIASAPLALAVSPPEDGLKVKVDLKHQNYYDSITGDPTILNSRFRVTLGNSEVRVDEYLRQFSMPGRDVRSIKKYIVDVTVSLSLAPTLLEDRTLETLEDKVDAALKQKEPYIRQQVEMGVDYKLSQDPIFNEFPPEVRQSIRNNLVEETLEKTISDLRSEANAKHEDRVDQIKTETTIQEVAVTMAYNINEKAVLFLKAGKYQQDIATGMNDDHLTEIESRRLGRSRTQRMSSAGPTTGVTAGGVYRADDFTVQAEIAIFHDRLAFINANEYIEQIVTLSDEDFENHRDLNDFNSQRIRINVRTNKVDFYITGGDFDGASAYSTGAVIRITPKLQAHVDYSKSDRSYTAEQGVSVYLSYDTKIFNKSVAIYAGQERLKNAPSASSSVREDETESVAGARITLLQGRIYRKIYGRLSIGVEGYRKERGSDKENGWRAGSQLEVIY